jgi:predicted transcriptional regulator
VTRRTVLLSVRPRWARKLIDGIKTAEVRRRFPRLGTNIDVYLYSSSPEKAVIGKLVLGQVAHLAVGEVWGRYGDQIEISQEELNEYLAGADEAAILHVESSTAWRQSVLLSDLRGAGIDPPQSWRYLSDEQATAVDRLAQDAIAKAES